MPVHDFKAQRLFCDGPLAAGAEIACTREQANYLRNVLRLRRGDEILVFNGRDGEWRTAISEMEKRACNLRCVTQVRPQSDGPDIDYLFAPLKRARLDYMVQKATELGVARLRPVLTRHTIAGRVNLERMRANVIEAAEQCGILRIPEVVEPVALDAAIAAWPSDRCLIFADEGAEVTSPIAALGACPAGPTALLIGPEGGFSEAERSLLLAQPFTLRLSLGPRVMRADTAAVAALAMLNAVVGDWR